MLFDTYPTSFQHLKRLDGRCRSPIADDASTSSTVTVHKQVKKGLKRVRFELEANKEYKCDTTADECRSMWYTPLEFRRFKSNTMKLAKHIRETEMDNHAPFSYSRVLTRVYEVCTSDVSSNDIVVLTQHERIHLQKWLQVASGRLGMDKWGVRTISQDKMARRHDMVDTVIHLQERNASPEEIKEACTCISRAGKLFAQVLASTQATCEAARVQ